MSKKYAVVTGASSGIGEQIAIELSRRGFSLVLVARREARLNALAQTLFSAIVFSADLSKEAECVRLCQFLETLPVFVMVNNAGFGECGEFLEVPLERELEMIDVNVRALHILSKFAFQKKGCKYLLNVASCAGLMPGGPYMATYYATKSYAASFSLALACEAKRKKNLPSVSVLCPGPVDTEFNEMAHVSFSFPGISSSACARYAVKKMFQKKALIVPSGWVRLGLFFSRFLPKNFFVKIAGKFQRRKFLKKI